MCLPAGLRQAFVTPDPLCAACLSNVEAGRIEEVESFVVDTLGVQFRGLLQLDAALVPGACPSAEMPSVGPNPALHGLDRRLPPGFYVAIGRNPSESAVVDRDWLDASTTGEASWSFVDEVVYAAAEIWTRSYDSTYVAGEYSHPMRAQIFARTDAAALARWNDGAPIARVLRVSIQHDV